MKKITVGIIGGAGYTGGELIRLLVNYPAAEIAFVQSKSHAGEYLHHVHRDLDEETTQRFTDNWKEAVDVLFLCVGHGEAKKFIEAAGRDLQSARIIDLSQDFRLHRDGARPLVNGRPFIYGLPELNREEIQSAHHIANPGCFATAIQLGLLPLAKAGLLHEVYTTGITGSTGAGQGLSETTHFSWRAKNIQAYKVLAHQHLPEIEQSLQQLAGAAFNSGLIHFVPWRGDFTRGIFVSSTLHCEKSLKELTELYKSFYFDHPFTSINQEAIFLKQVVNTNRCIIQLEKVGAMLVVHSAIDNLLKGASGQALQNMNLMFGLDEKAGLKLKANYF